MRDSLHFRYAYATAKTVELTKGGEGKRIVTVEYVRAEEVKLPVHPTFHEHIFRILRDTHCTYRSGTRSFPGEMVS